MTTNRMGLTDDNLRDLSAFLLDSYTGSLDTLRYAYASEAINELLACREASKKVFAITTEQEMLHVRHGSNGYIMDACRTADFERKGDTVIPLYAAPQHVSLTNEGKWIKCSERMPEPNAFVQVSNGVWVGIGMYSDAGHLEPEEHWQDEHHEFIDLLHFPVTHWMPLPDLPQC